MMSGLVHLAAFASELTAISTVRSNQAGAASLVALLLSGFFAARWLAREWIMYMD